MICRDTSLCFLKKLLSLALTIAGILYMVMESNAYSRLARDSLKDVTIVENHSEVLASWVRKGIRKADLIHIDMHDDMRLVPDDKMEQLKHLYQRKDYISLTRANSLSDRGLYDIGNFVYVAARLGIINNVYWIIPFRFSSLSDAKENLKRFLKRNRFSDGDIQSFSFKDGCFCGRRNDIPVSICNIDTLPSFKKPVLVSVDIDFLPYAATEYRLTKLESARMLLKALSSKAYRVIDASVAYSVNGGFTDIQSRWLGDVVVQMFREPHFIFSKREYGLWSAYQKADTCTSQNRNKDAKGCLTPLLKRYKNNSVLLTYSAIAFYQLNDIEKAFQYAEKACLSNRAYCYTLPHIGRYLTVEDRLAEAERFFLRGWSLNPEMLYYQWTLCFAFTNAGEHYKALSCFEALVPLIMSSSLHFLIGHLYLELEDEVSATEHFNLAQQLLDSESNDLEDWPESRDAITQASLLYEKRGQVESAKKMKEILRRISRE